MVRLKFNFSIQNFTFLEALDEDSINGRQGSLSEYQGDLFRTELRFQHLKIYQFFVN